MCSMLSERRAIAIAGCMMISEFPCHHEVTCDSRAAPARGPDRNSLACRALGSNTSTACRLASVTRPAQGLVCSIALELGSSDRRSRLLTLEARRCSPAQALCTSGAPRLPERVPASSANDASRGGWRALLAFSANSCSGARLSTVAMTVVRSCISRVCGRLPGIGSRRGR